MTVNLINANSLQIPLQAQSVHMIASSPPYWGLRDYGEDDQLGKERLHDCLAWARNEDPCNDCFVCAIRKIAKEAWRVLRDDGTFWLNLGDSYNGYPGNVTKGGKLSGANQHARQQKPSGYGMAAQTLKPKDLVLIPARVALALQADGWIVRQDIVWSKTNPMSESVNGWRWERHRIKNAHSRRAQKDSYHTKAQNGVGAPHSERNGREWTDQSSRYVDCPGCEKCHANNGYVLRRGAWRPTKAHEYIFLLAKSEQYYCDKYAVTEPHAISSIERITQPNFTQQTGGEKDYRNGVNPNRSARKALESLRSKFENADSNVSGAGTSYKNGHSGYFDARGYLIIDLAIGRNKWSVWELPTKGYPGAHFAVWPPDLVEPMIKAGTSEKGCCPHCGAQWARVINKSEPEPTKSNPNPVKAYPAASNTQGVNSTLHMTRKTETVDWMATCECPEHDPIPCIVLDIFSGSGTTLEVARQLGRDGIGLDLSFGYLVNEAKERLLLTAIESFENGDGVASSPTRKRPSKVSEMQMSLL